MKKITESVPELVGGHIDRLTMAVQDSERVKVPWSMVRTVDLKKMIIQNQTLMRRMVNAEMKIKESNGTK